MENSVQEIFSPFLEYGRYLKNRLSLAMRGLPSSLEPKDVFRDVATGIIDIPAIALLILFIISFGYLSTWKGSFPIEFDFFTLLWMLAIGGIVFHLLVWGSPKRDWAPESSSTKMAIMSFGLGFSVLIILQGVVAYYFTHPKTISLSVIPLNILYTAAGMGEEYLFAFCSFSFLIFMFCVLGRGGYVGAIFALLGDCLIFAPFHFFVLANVYKGVPSFLPAIFIGRFVLDAVYLISGGRIVVPVAVHMLSNFMSSTFSVPEASVQFVMFMVVCGIMIQKRYVSRVKGKGRA